MYVIKPQLIHVKFKVEILRETCEIQLKTMSHQNYVLNVVQTNGCRTWTNPLAGTTIPLPIKPIELFISQIPKAGFSEAEILPYFERFGQIYEFRLLIDYENQNRGFAYIIYFDDKAALSCLDCMGYFMIQPGVILDVERSEQKSSLVALGIPRDVDDSNIEIGIRKTFANIENVIVQRRMNEVAAVLKFSNHDSALQVNFQKEIYSEFHYEGIGIHNKLEMLTENKSKFLF